MMAANRAWFEDWFNTPYYHILYKHRDYTEAQLFIDALCNYLHLPANTRVLDLACGQGRHAIYLNKKGFEVTGADLSEENIRKARLHENERLHFVVHDKREVLWPEHFDAVFNLFTSFGYLDSHQANEQVIMAAAANLRKGGIMVLDFMNTPQVLASLVAQEQKEMEGIEFNIERYIQNGFIVKDIRFEADGRKHHFREQVMALQMADFETYFGNANLEIKDILGDYQLGTYREGCPRMIFIVEK
jgi:SAM-dependent methyltransferase